MKRNAIIRIVLWSIVLLVLLAVLFTLIYVPGAGRRLRNETPAETAVPVPLVTSPEENRTEETIASATFPLDNSRCNAVATSNVNIRAMPSTQAQAVGMVELGTALEITRQELVQGHSWGYMVSPINGWVAMDFVDLLGEIPEEKIDIQAGTSESQEIQGYGVAVDAASMQNMEIEWAAGTIVIQPMDITEIRITEEGVNQDSDPMVWKVRDGKLSLQYSNNTDHDFGMGLLRGEHSKNLTIQVPSSWQCNSLEIDAASASLHVKDLTIQEMEFDGASGTCVFDNCTVEKLDIDTASGDVRFTGNLTQMECDAASANIILELANVPRSLDLDTASGDLDVTLPADAGFAVRMDTMSGEFTSDFTTTNRNGSYVAGDGRCRIDVDAMSGDITIRKAA